MAHYNCYGFPRFPRGTFITSRIYDRSRQKFSKPFTSLRGRHEQVLIIFYDFTSFRGRGIREGIFLRRYWSFYVCVVADIGVNSPSRIFSHLISIYLSPSSLACSWKKHRERIIFKEILKPLCMSSCRYRCKLTVKNIFPFDFNIFVSVISCLLVKKSYK